MMPPALPPPSPLGKPQAAIVSWAPGRRSGASATATQLDAPNDPPRPNFPAATVAAPVSAVPWWPRPDESTTSRGSPLQLASSMCISSTRPVVSGVDAGDGEGEGTGVGPPPLQADIVAARKR